MGGGRGGRKDGGREGGARTEPALFRREHRAPAPAEREEERPKNRRWGGELAGRDKEGELKKERWRKVEKSRDKDRHRKRNTEKRKTRSRDRQTQGRNVS